MHVLFRVLFKQIMEKQYTYEYPRPAVATDCVVFGFDGNKLRVLLIERGGDPFKGHWALPGGFLESDETVEQAAQRELREETGLYAVRMEQFRVFSAIDRDPRDRVLSVGFFALVRMMQAYGGSDAVQAKWFEVESLPELAFDHNEIIKAALKALREKIAFEPIVFDMLEEKFSMTKLQKLYEAILGISFDRRNFYRKMLTLGVLERADGKQSAWLMKSKGLKVSEKIDQSKSGEAKRSIPSRIPYLYFFNRDKYNQLKKKGNGFRLEF